MVAADRDMVRGPHCCNYTVVIIIVFSGYLLVLRPLLEKWGLTQKQLAIVDLTIWFVIAYLADSREALIVVVFSGHLLVLQPLLKRWASTQKQLLFCDLAVWVIIIALSL